MTDSELPLCTHEFIKKNQKKNKAFTSNPMDRVSDAFVLNQRLLGIPGAIHFIVYRFQNKNRFTTTTTIEYLLTLDR